jgi:hypothetical protein
MVSNAEMFLNDEAEPNSAASEWDMSDAPAFNVEDFQIPSETDVRNTEEARNYEKRERALEDELYLIADRRANGIMNIGDEFVKTMKSIEHPLAGRMENNIDDIYRGKKATGRATLESLFTYVDSMFPSPYSEEERNAKKVGDSEDEFRRASIREGQVTGDSIDDLAKTFTMDGSENDLYIASQLKNLGQGTFDHSSALLKAIIDYANKPNGENRSQLYKTQSDHERVLSNSLFNIAETFDRSKTQAGRRMFEPTVELATTMTRSSEEYFEGIMKYLKFKIDNSNTEKPEEVSPNAAAFVDALPGDVIS